MAKKNYEELVIAVKALCCEDIVTASPAGTDNDGLFSEAWN